MASSPGGLRKNILFSEYAAKANEGAKGAEETKAIVKTIHEVKQQLATETTKLANLKEEKKKNQVSTDPLHHPVQNSPNYKIGLDGHIIFLLVFLHPYSTHLTIHMIERGASLSRGGAIPQQRDIGDSARHPDNTSPFPFQRMIGR